MKLCRDRDIRKLFCFLCLLAVLCIGTGAGICAWQTEAARTMFLEHDRAVVSSLLDQGVSKGKIAAAITSQEGNEDGAGLLAEIGITKDSEIKYMPFIRQFQKTIGRLILAAGIFLYVLVFAGIFYFLRKRDLLYRQAAGVIKGYIEGDYSRRMPQMQEGTVYQLFGLVDQLATMLQAENNAEHKAREFLKNTISDISHQLKTPLAALSMYQEIIENETDNRETVKTFSEKMGLALGRMEQLILSMLKITRLDAGSIVFEKRECSVQDLVIQSLSGLYVRAERENKEITVEGDPQEALVCDPEWTREAVGNIVKNALDHTAPGGTIRISWERSPTMLRIQIADDGEGISPEDLHHIFKRFYRSEKSSDTQGTGLGLPLAKGIIEGQGGALSVRSSLNEGAVFTLSFLTEL